MHVPNVFPGSITANYFTTTNNDATTLLTIHYRQLFIYSYKNNDELWREEWKLLTDWFDPKSISKIIKKNSVLTGWPVEYNTHKVDPVVP